MYFPTEYKVLSQQKFQKGNCTIVPIRLEDKEDIKRWRNEQMYHLRQNKLLTTEDQELYFNNIVKKIFDDEKPGQILFSYLEKDVCIGYGGLVHINWDDKHAEISFLMDTQLEKGYFQAHWSNFLQLIEKVAFEDLNLHKIFTYAFDVRPHLYSVLESQGYIREAILKEHCFFNEEWKDVIIHSKIYPKIVIRPATAKDSKMIFGWANDPDTRNNSFQSKIIEWEEHDKWFHKRLDSKEHIFYICEVNKKAAALVRFDKFEDHWVIGININPLFRGQHLAKPLLKASLEVFKPKNDILAYIKPDNQASIKSFEGVGFQYFSKTQIHGQEALVYKYPSK